MRINAHAQLSRQNENAQAAIMVSLVASGRPTVALSNKVGLCHERTLPENFWKKNFIHLQKKICCQQNGLFVRSKSGRPIFSYFMARARCCLLSITLLFMSYDKNNVDVYRAHRVFSYFRAINSLSPVAEGLKKIITKIARPG